MDPINIHADRYVYRYTMADDGSDDGPVDDSGIFCLFISAISLFYPRFTIKKVTPFEYPISR